MSIIFICLAAQWLQVDFKTVGTNFLNIGQQRAVLHFLQIDVNASFFHGILPNLLRGITGDLLHIFLVFKGCINLLYVFLHGARNNLAQSLLRFLALPVALIGGIIHFPFAVGSIAVLLREVHAKTIVFGFFARPFSGVQRFNFFIRAKGLEVLDL